MDEPLAVALKFGFLAVLYLFLLWVARSALKDLARGGDNAAAAPVEPPQARRAGGAPQLVVVAAKGHEPGAGWQIDGGVTLGRTAEIKVEDPFASSSHARIYSRGDSMYLEDMGSTNGTYLNGRQISAAERLKVGDVIRIGDSEYRYQE
jgi:pSer/pThr/pTyr-binding forkhead associated (FHA) protein